MKYIGKRNINDMRGKFTHFVFDAENAVSTNFGAMYLGENDSKEIFAMKEEAKKQVEAWGWKVFDVCYFRGVITVRVETTNNNFGLEG